MCRDLKIFMQLKQHSISIRHFDDEYPLINNLLFLIFELFFNSQNNLQSFNVKDFQEFQSLSTIVTEMLN